MPTLYSPSKKYFNRNDSSFHGGPLRCFFFFPERRRRRRRRRGERRRGRSFVSLSLSMFCNKPSRMTRIHADLFHSSSSSSSSSSSFPFVSFLRVRFQFLPDFAEFRPRKVFAFIFDAGRPACPLRPLRPVVLLRCEILCERIPRLDFAEFHRVHRVRFA